MTLEEAEEATKAGLLQAKMIPMDQPLLHLQCMDVPEKLEKQARNGVALRVDVMGDTLNEGENLRIYLHGRFFGIGTREREWIKWKAVFPEY